MSGFFLYSQAYRAQVKADNPDASFGDLVSHCHGLNGVNGFVQSGVCGSSEESVQLGCV